MRKVIGTLATNIVANAEQFAAEFNRADNVVARNTSKWQRTFQGGLKLGIGITGAQAALGLVNQEIRHVIANIERIPGVPAEVVTSITEARTEFQKFRDLIDRGFANMLHWGKQFAQSIGAGLAMMFGSSGKDVTDALSKLPSLDDEARAKDPAFDEKVQAAARRLAQAQTEAARARMTPAARFNDLNAEAARLDKYAADGTANSLQKAEASIAAEQRRAEANKIFAKAQDDSNRAMNEWLTLRFRGANGMLPDREAASKLRGEISDLMHEVEDVNEKMMAGGSKDIALVEKRTELYGRLKNKQEELNIIADRQKQLLNEVAAEIGGAFAGALEEAILQGKKLSEVLQALWQDLARILIRRMLIMPIANAITGGLGGVFGKLFGFADGGRPPVGTPYLVGERGPELRVDDRPGTIVPNHLLKFGGRAGGITYAPVVSVAAGITKQELLPTLIPILRQHGRHLAAMIDDSLARGGSISEAYG